MPRLSNRFGRAKTKPTHLPTYETHPIYPRLGIISQTNLLFQALQYPQRFRKFKLLYRFIPEPFGHSLAIRCIDKCRESADQNRQQHDSLFIEGTYGRICQSITKQPCVSFPLTTTASTYADEPTSSVRPVADFTIAQMID